MPNEVPDRYRALVLVGAVLGLRWGEAIGLRVQDVDFMRRTVTVAQTVEEVSGHLRIVREAKTDASLRTVTAPQFLVDVVAQHLAAYRYEAVGDREALVFLGPRGGILRRRFGERVLNPAVKRAGAGGLTFHGMRHAAITALAEEEVHPTTMKHRAGHATAKLTMNLYSRVTDASDRAAADALERRFTIAISERSGPRVAHDVSDGHP